VSRLYSNKKLLVGVLLACLLGVFAFVFYDPRLKPGWEPFFWVLFLREDASVYAPGYSEAAFNRVQPGMSRSEVLALLGPPLVKYDGSSNPKTSEIWRYSQAPPDKNYWLRIVIFDKNGIVSGKLGYYFVD